MLSCEWERLGADIVYHRWTLGQKVLGPFIQLSVVVYAVACLQARRQKLEIVPFLYLLISSDGVASLHARGQKLVVAHFVHLFAVVVTIPFLQDLKLLITPLLLYLSSPASLCEEVE